MKFSARQPTPSPKRNSQRSLGIQVQVAAALVGSIALAACSDPPANVTIYQVTAGSGSTVNAAGTGGGSASGGSTSATGGSGNSTSTGGSSQATGGSSQATGGTGTGGSGSGNGTGGSGSTGGTDNVPGSGGTGSGDGSGGTGSTGSTGGSGGTGGVPLDLPTDPSGFTELTPSSDTVTIYVSSSTGDDENDGLSPETAVATPRRGMSLLRDGSADWLLFKRGDVWDTAFGGWGLSGRSPTERMVISAYGEGERPRLEFSDDAGIFTSGGISEKTSIDNLMFVSLHLVGANHDVTRGAPSGKNPYCVNWLRGAQDLHFEDNRFEYCQVNFQDFDGYPARRVRFYRNLFLDSYSVDDSHAQGIYLDGVEQAVVEENVFDHCGWHPDVPAAVPTIFNHCIYWQEQSAPDGVVRRNVILRGSSHGAQLRSSGTIEENVFAGNAIGGFLGGEWDRTPAGAREGVAIGNLFTEGEDTLPRQGHTSGTAAHRGWAFELITGISNVELSDNLITHCRSVNDSCRSLPASLGSSLIENNIVWDWDNVASGMVEEATGPFADPDRTLASYNASLGGTESFEAFAQEVRKQSKTNWRPALTAPAIIEYFREGFEPGN